jgi:hypothetical protein
MVVVHWLLQFPPSVFFFQEPSNWQCILEYAIFMSGKRDGSKWLLGIHSLSFLLTLHWTRQVICPYVHDWQSGRQVYSTCTEVLWVTWKWARMYNHLIGKKVNIYSNNPIHHHRHVTSWGRQGSGQKPLIYKPVFPILECCHMKKPGKNSSVVFMFGKTCAKVLFMK